MWCYKTAFYLLLGTQIFLERKAIEGDSPVEVTEKDFSVFLSTVYWKLSRKLGDINF